VRESRTPGSARGAGGNSRPYRDNHIGPEPSGGTREGLGEASAGDCAGQPLSRESFVTPDADAFPTAEGNTDGALARALGRPGAV
jgi:hypothetical protein